VNTGQVEEVRLLVKFVKDGTGSVLDIGGSEDGDGVLWKGFGKVGAALVILESRDSGSHWVEEV
jgi:hypothetical protein